MTHGASVFPRVQRFAASGAALLCAVVTPVACSSREDRSQRDSVPVESAAAREARDARSEGGSHSATEVHVEGEENRVTLGEAAYRTAQIRVEPAVAHADAFRDDELEVPGQVEFDPRRLAVISSRAPGRIERLTVVEGDRVQAGQTVALVYTPSYVTAQNDFLQAARRAKLLEGTPDGEGTTAIAQAARRRLRLLGVGEQETERLEAGGEPKDYLALAAPFSGRIMETHALSGQAVDAGEEIFKVADLSVVDVVAEVTEAALPLVRIGQEATIGIAAYPSMRFGGRVERLRGELNPETRTVRAVIHVSNSTGRLRPGMFATVRLSVSTGSVTRERSAPDSPAAPSVLLTIPESAVVSEGEHRYVFVEVGPRTFERREIEVASLAPPGSTRPTADRVAVRRGLFAGERVVVEGAFTLKSELAKEGFGEHGH